MTLYNGKITFLVFTSLLNNTFLAFWLPLWTEQRLLRILSSDSEISFLSCDFHFQICHCLSLEALPCIYLHLLSVQCLTQLCKAFLKFFTMSAASDYTKAFSISSRVLMMLFNKTCPYDNSIVEGAGNSSENWPLRLPLLSVLKPLLDYKRIFLYPFLFWPLWH